MPHALYIYSHCMYVAVTYAQYEPYTRTSYRLVSTTYTTTLYSPSLRLVLRSTFNRQIPLART